MSKEAELLKKHRTSIPTAAKRITRGANTEICCR